MNKLARKIEGEISLRDNYTKVIQRAAKQTSQFRKDVEAAKKAIREAEAEKKKIRDLKIKAYLDKTGLSKITNQLKPLKNVAINMTAKYEVAASKIRKLRELAEKPIQLAIKAKDMASPVIDKIKTGIKAIAIAGAAIAIGAAGAGFKGASDLERQQISMEHFIGVNNKGWNQGKVKQQSDAYLGWLRQNANITPFDTGEVVGAGSYALGIAEGDIKQAQELVRLAEDLSALNPGTTVEQAMQALGSAKMGEYESMKTFKVKLSKEMVDAAGGFQQVLKTQVVPKFKGGAEKLSGSIFGQISTIKGVVETTLTDVFMAPLKKSKGPMTQFANWLQSNQQKITNIGIKALDTVSNAVSTALPYIQQAFTVAKPLFQSYWTYLQTLINLIKPIIIQLWTGVLLPLFSWVVANMPTFQNAIGTVFAWLAPKLRDVVSIFSWLVKVWVESWPLISSILQTSWNIISPALNIIWNALKMIFDILRLLWPLAKFVLTGIWAILKPILDGISLLLKGISKVGSFVGKGITIVADALLEKPTTMPSHASGLPYVPRDNYTARLHQGERVLTASENRRYNKGDNLGGVTVSGNNFYIREEADIDKVASKLYSKMLESKLNYA